MERSASRVDRTGKAAAGSGNLWSLQTISAGLSLHTARVADTTKLKTAS
jgi:hypothetical protein